jgi:hypothetical protein
MPSLPDASSSNSSGQPSRSGPPEDAASRDRTVAALHALAKPQPRAEPAPPPIPLDQLPNSASGFVGMLAKGQGSGDTHIAMPASSPNASSRSRYALKMAREIPPPAPASTPAERLTVPARRGPAGRPANRRLLARIIAALAVMLLLIGLWAAGALVYMATVHPIASEDVHYPLIRWSLDVGNMGGYTSASRLMGWSMLLGLPVGIAFLLFSRLLGPKRK